MGMRDLRMPLGGWVPTIHGTQSPPYTRARVRSRGGARLEQGQAGVMPPDSTPAPSHQAVSLLNLHYPPAKAQRGRERVCLLLCPRDPGRAWPSRGSGNPCGWAAARPSLPCGSGCTSARLPGARQAATRPGPFTLPNRARETGRVSGTAYSVGSWGGTTRRFN